MVKFSLINLSLKVFTRSRGCWECNNELSLSRKVFFLLASREGWKYAHVCRKIDHIMFFPLLRLAWTQNATTWSFQCCCAPWSPPASWSCCTWYWWPWWPWWCWYWRSWLCWHGDKIVKTGQNRPTLRVLYTTKYTIPGVGDTDYHELCDHDSGDHDVYDRDFDYHDKMDDLIMLSRVSNSSGMLMYFTITKPGSPELG